MANGMPGTYGFDRRDETADPNAGGGVPPAAQVPVGGVSTPRGINVAAVGSDMAELSQALGDFGHSVAGLFDQKQDQWRLEGQLQYAQGVTEEEIAKSGNFYTQQGWQAMQARTAMGDWYQTKQTEIAAKDHATDPSAYRASLMEDFKKVSKGLHNDTYLNKMTSEMAQNFFPALVEQQTKAHNEWNRSNTKTSYTNMLVQQAGMIDGEHPGDTISAVQGMMDPGMSGLSKDDEEEAQYNALSLSFQQGNASVWEALGGEAGLRARGWKSEHIAGAAKDYDAYNTGQNTDYARSIENQMNSIKAGLELDGNIPLAMKRVDGLFETIKANPRWNAANARTTSQASISQQIAKYHPDYNQAQMNAAVTRMTDPRVLQRAAEVWANSEAGFYKTPEQGTAAIQQVAEMAGIPEQDVPLLFAAFDDNRRQWGMQAAAEIQRAGAAALKEQTEQQQRANAWATGTLSLLDSGDQQKGIMEERNRLAGEYSAKAAQAPQQETQQQYVERNLYPKLAKMNIVDKDTQTSLTSAFSRDMIQADGSVSPTAVAAYDMLIRMGKDLQDGGYGLQPSQVDAYLSTPEAKTLYHQAKDFDVGDMDSATALHAAVNQLNKKQTTDQEIAGQKREVSDEMLNKFILEESANFKGGDILQTNMYSSLHIPGTNWNIGGDNIWEEEMKKAEEDSHLKQAIRQRATVETALNPNMTTTAAVRKAAAHVMGRAQFVLGTFVQSGEDSTVLEDMGISGPEQNPAHLAALAWISKHGPLPVEEGGFGTMYGRVNPDPNLPTWKRWLGNVIHMSDTRSDVKFAPFSDRTAPDMLTWYNPQQKMFYFQQYADTTHDATAGPVMHVSAKELGDFYNNTIRPGTQDSPFVSQATGAVMNAGKDAATSAVEYMIKNSIGFFNVPNPPQ